VTTDKYLSIWMNKEKKYYSSIVSSISEEVRVILYVSNILEVI
jgi:hypothetical protein